MRTREVPDDVGLMPEDCKQVPPATMLLSLWCCWPYQRRTRRVWSRTWYRCWLRQWSGRCAADLWRSTTLDERCSRRRWCADIGSDFLTHWLPCWYVDTIVKVWALRSASLPVFFHRRSNCRLRCFVVMASGSNHRAPLLPPDLWPNFSGATWFRTVVTTVSNCAKYASGELAGSVNKSEDCRRLSKSAMSIFLMSR